MKVLVLPNISSENKQKIVDAFPQLDIEFDTQKDVTQEKINSADIVVGNPHKGISLYNENLKALFLNSAGSDTYVKEGVLHPNTKLTNASGSYGKAIAEHTIGMILMINKNLKTFVLHMQQHKWQNVPQGKEIAGSTVAIVGLGDLGYELAKKIKVFGCHIIGVKRRVSEVPEYIDELYTTKDLDEVLKRADFVVLALPHSNETYHIMNKERLMMMKKDAVLVNIGRGSAVETEALISVLNEGHLYGVCLDVVEEEPLNENSPLWDMDRVMITPHCSGGFKWQSVQNYYTDLVISNLNHFLNDEPLENEVDFVTGYRKVIKYK